MSDFIDLTLTVAILFFPILTKKTLLKANVPFLSSRLRHVKQRNCGFEKCSAEFPALIHAFYTPPSIRQSYVPKYHDEQSRPIQSRSVQVPPEDAECNDAIESEKEGEVGRASRTIC
jgi:hypothetical protein